MKKNIMDKVNIYIQLLDGSTCWVPMPAEKLSETSFKILDDSGYEDFEEFDLHLYEFWPGDIVEIGNHEFSDGSIGLAAKKLIESGQYPDRQFRVFKYKGTLGQLSIDQETAQYYTSEIDRIKKSELKGNFIYPSLLEVVNKLHKLTEKKAYT